MSYDYSKFKVKKLENFRIPVTSLYPYKPDQHESNWHFDREDHDDGTVIFDSYGHEVEMSGVIENENGNEVFVCKSIDCSGEGSGTVMEEILEPAFRDSQGELVAVLVWEGGDTIQRLSVDNGVVVWEDVES